MAAIRPDIVLIYEVIEKIKVDTEAFTYLFIYSSGKTI